MVGGQAFGKHDPFDETTRRAAQRLLLTDIADFSERGAAVVVQAALVGSEDAREALADRMLERGSNNAPFGPALTTYVNILTTSGLPRVRLPHGAPQANFVENWIVVHMVIDLRAAFSRSAAQARSQ